MSLQEAFEKIYAKLHDVTPESLVQYRFCTTDGYRLPQMASHYRVYCETMESINQDIAELKTQVEAMKKEIAALKPEKIRTDRTTVGYTGCLVCGQYTGHGGLQCPNLAARSLAMENQRITPVGEIRSVHPLDEIARRAKP